MLCTVHNLIVSSSRLTSLVLQIVEWQLAAILVSLSPHTSICSEHCPLPPENKQLFKSFNPNEDHELQNARKKNSGTEK